MSKIAPRLSLDSRFQREPSEVFCQRGAVGLRNARAKGKRLGRPRRILDTARIATLRKQGISWKRIAAQLRVGVGTIQRGASAGSKIQEKVT